jgi:HSP20 family molecular chaperone IbpA
MINVYLKSDLDNSETPVSQNRQQHHGKSNWRFTVYPRTWRPATDVFETDEEVVVRVEIAGMKESDFEISVNRNLLSISGARMENKERRAYQQMEIPFGEFSTEVEISSSVDIEKVTAKYENGFLWVFMPIAKPKKIKIKSE